MITITTFGQVPTFAQGLVRDLRVRWALQEAGLGYQTRLVDRDALAAPEYRARQPFGQVPAYEEDGFFLFESGAIVLHIGQSSEALLPAEPEARARATAWVFAALSSVEPALHQVIDVDVINAAESWSAARRPLVIQAAQRRLDALSAWLGERAWLEDRFTAGDLMMTTVLRSVRHTDLVANTPGLAAYQQRCEARPAFVRALADHMAVFQA